MSFKKFLEPKHSIQYTDEDDEEEISVQLELDDIHERLERRRPSRAIHEKLERKQSMSVKSKKARIPITLEDEDSNTVKLLSSQTDSSQDKNSDSEFEDSIGDDDKPDIVRNVQEKPNEDTFDSWQNMDFPTNHHDRPELPRAYFSDGPTPVNLNFLI